MKSKCFVLVMLLSFLNLASCIHHQVKPFMETVSEEVAFPKVIASKAVSIKSNVDGENKLFNFCRWHYAYSNDLTDSSIELLKIILKKNEISVIDAGEKQLVLEIIDANCNAKAFSFELVVNLSVNAGESIEKRFKGKQNVGNAYSTTWAIERAIADALRQMLVDQDIYQYLQI